MNQHELTLIGTQCESEYRYEHAWGHPLSQRVGPSRAPQTSVPCMVAAPGARCLRGILLISLGIAPHLSTLTAISALVIDSTAVEDAYLASVNLLRNGTCYAPRRDV
jgi:hypothetical protein